MTRCHRKLPILLEIFLDNACHIDMSIVTSVITPGIMELSEIALKTLDSLPVPLPKPGKPRLDGRKALISDFYEPLVLLETLQRTLGCLMSAPALPSEPAQQIHPWHLFLNQLAWLCDHRNDGNSTSMIAVEVTTIGSKFWLAANFDPLQKGLSHLKLVLTKLTNLGPVASTNAPRDPQ